MPMPRTYTDSQLTAAIAGANCWADVMEALGKKRSGSTRHVKMVAKKLMLNLDHLQTGPVRTKNPHPFQGQKHFGAKGRGGLAIAATWFLGRGYNVSIPMEPGPYDMIIESDVGLKRVQVKMTSHRERSNGRYVVRLTRNIYDPSLPSNAAGKYKSIAYTSDDMDMFFIIAGNDNYFLIPLDVVTGKTSITLDEKYSAFLI